MVKFVQDNPGLTSAMIAILWRRPYGTISSVLYNLVQSGRVFRNLGVGMRGGKFKAWRYHADPAIHAVDALLKDTKI